VAAAADSDPDVGLTAFSAAVMSGLSLRMLTCCGPAGGLVESRIAELDSELLLALCVWCFTHSLSLIDAVRRHTRSRSPHRLVHSNHWPHFILTLELLPQHPLSIKGTNSSQTRDSPPSLTHSLTSDASDDETIIRHKVPDEKLRTMSCSSSSFGFPSSSCFISSFNFARRSLSESKHHSGDLVLETCYNFISHSCSSQRT
jgi:hypothetical protein